jgi:predicted RNA-binding Zn-ribbon protein involved in translation (DUF1610 family)
MSEPERDLSSDTEPNATDVMQVCPNCSTQLRDKSCKLVCPKCGFFLSCSDFY